MTLLQVLGRTVCYQAIDTIVNGTFLVERSAGLRFRPNVHTDATLEEPITLDREALTTDPDGVCHYGGSLTAGLRLRVARDHELTLSPEQLGAMVASLGARNPLLEECRGYAYVTTSLPKRITQRIGWGQVGPSEQAAHQPSSIDFAAWARARAPTVFGRSLEPEAVFALEAVLVAEGVLSSRHLCTVVTAQMPKSLALHGLQGRRVIYEESRRFVAADLSRIAIERNEYGDESVWFHVRPTSLPGFNTEISEEFTAGGAIEGTSMDLGMASGYMGTWALITGPESVNFIIESAARFCDQRKLLRLVREITAGRRSSVY